MAGIDIFTIIVLAIMIIAILAIVVTLGILPGRIAKQRQHPQAEAIAVGSWLALVFGFALWPLVLTWAFTRSDKVVNSQTELPVHDEGAK